MSGGVLPGQAQFDCRACGSTYQKPSNNKKLCAACWDEMERWLKSVKVTDKSEMSVNKWMARRLMMDAERLFRYGMTGRCEAISSAGNRRWLDGMDIQCRMRATNKRDGRRVCSKHHTATAPIYIGDLAHDPYTDMQRVLTDLAQSDEQFRQCLVAAIEATQHRDRSMIANEAKPAPMSD